MRIDGVAPAEHHRELKDQGFRVDDRIRTGDRLDHNQELYQLSYVHRAGSNLAGFDQFGEGAEAGGRAGQEVGF